MVYIVSDLKKNIITKFAVKWMDLECIILNKVTQSQKENKPHVLPHMQDLVSNRDIYSIACRKEKKAKY